MITLQIYEISQLDVTMRMRSTVSNGEKENDILQGLASIAGAK